MARGLVFAACLFGLATEASAQIRILSPNWLVQQFGESQGNILGSTATFGAPFYGDRVLGQLFWAESVKGNTHCTDDDYDVPQPDSSLRGESGDGKLINIIMVRRGKCSFTTKVKIAATKGAHAVIIVDRDDSNLKASDLHRIIVADDGYGGNIHIPSVLISKQDGQRLIDAAKRGPVITELKWDIPTNHVVEMDLWMSSGSLASMSFLRDFSARRKAMNQVVKFTPHYQVFSMPSSDPAIYRDLCSDTSGKYCTEDPDGSGPITGKEVLEEDVRQLCIHEMTKVARTSLADLQAGKTMVEYAAPFWNYVEKFAESCPLAAPTPQERFGKACAEKLMQKVGLDVAKVSECMVSTRDAKLKGELENTAWSPRALRINGWRYSGMMDAELVTRAICSGFISQPDECKNLLTVKQIVNGETAGGGGVTLRTFLGSLVVVAVLGCWALLLYKRYMKKELSATVREQVYLEVHNQMAQYSKF